jgi:hypothetical protein
MFGRRYANRGRKIGGRVGALALVAGLAVPGAFVALTPSTAAAQGSDPLGPTVAQLEALTQELAANTEYALLNLEGEVQYGVYPEIYCLVNAITVRQYPCDPED